MRKLFTLLTILLLSVPFCFAGDEVSGWTEIGSGAYAANIGVGNATPSWTAPLIVPSGAQHVAFCIREGTYAQTIGASANVIGAVTNAKFQLIASPSLLVMPTPHTYIKDATGEGITMIRDDIRYESAGATAKCGFYIQPIAGMQVVRFHMIRSGAAIAYSIIARFDD